MPIHFDDLDVVSEVAGLSSALIVPCNVCPAVTVAVRENRPFMQLYRSVLKSAPFDEYVRALTSRLRENGVRAEVFRSTPAASAASSARKPWALMLTGSASASCPAREAASR